MNSFVTNVSRISFSILLLPTPLRIRTPAIASMLVLGSPVED